VREMPQFPRRPKIRHGNEAHEQREHAPGDHLSANLLHAFGTVRFDLRLKIAAHISEVSCLPDQTCFPNLKTVPK